MPILGECPEKPAPSPARRAARSIARAIALSLSAFPGSRGEAKTGAPGPAPPGRIASSASSAAVPM